MSSSLLVFVVVFLLSIAVSDVANGISADVVVDTLLLTEKIGTNRTIIVDQSGKEDFTSVQDAINSIDEGNSLWVIIHVRKGVYREKIIIPEKKQYIFMRGNGKGKTIIIWNDSSTNNSQTATLTVEANHFIAWGITFKNDAPVGLAGILTNRTVAAFVTADKVAFYHCGFFSFYNTLFDAIGRHYYDNCYITGSIDFIFGRARSLFKSCEIFVRDDKRTTIHGSITAHNRATNDDSGYVFYKGKVYGIGRVFLGRAKAAYSRAIFAKTYLSKTIVAEGWTNWSYNARIENLALGEHHCHGPGAKSDKRIKWSRQLTENEATQYMSVDFINGKEWLPVHFES